MATLDVKSYRGHLDRHGIKPSPLQSPVSDASSSFNSVAPIAEGKPGLHVLGRSDTLEILSEKPLAFDGVYDNGLHALRRIYLRSLLQRDFVEDHTQRVRMSSTWGDALHMQLRNDNLASRSETNSVSSMDNGNVFNEMFNCAGYVSEVSIAPGQTVPVILAYLAERTARLTVSQARRQSTEHRPLDPGTSDHGSVSDAKAADVDADPPVQVTRAAAAGPFGGCDVRSIDGALDFVAESEGHRTTLSIPISATSGKSFMSVRVLDVPDGEADDTRKTSAHRKRHSIAQLEDRSLVKLVTAASAQVPTDQGIDKAELVQDINENGDALEGPERKIEFCEISPKERPKRMIQVHNHSALSLWYTVGIEEASDGLLVYDETGRALFPNQAHVLGPVPPYSSAYLTLAFTATSHNDVYMRLAIENCADGNNYVNFDVSGTVVQEPHHDLITLSTSSLDFGTIVAGEWIYRLLVVRNIADYPLDLHFSTPDLVRDAGAVSFSLEQLGHEDIIEDQEDASSDKQASAQPNADNKSEPASDDAPISDTDSSVSSKPPDREVQLLPSDSRLERLRHIKAQCALASDKKHFSIEDLYVKPGVNYRVVVGVRPARTSSMLSPLDFSVSVRARPWGTRAQPPPNVRSHRTVICHALACTSFIRATPQAIDMGDVQVGTSRTAYLAFENLSPIPTLVEVSLVSKAVWAPREPILLPPRGSARCRITMAPRRANDNYRKEISVHNLLNPHDTRVCFVHANNVQSSHMTAHSLLYGLDFGGIQSLSSPAPPNPSPLRPSTPANALSPHPKDSQAAALDLGTVPMNAQALRRLRISNTHDAPLTLSLEPSTRDLQVVIPSDGILDNQIPCPLRASRVRKLYKALQGHVTPEFLALLEDVKTSPRKDSQPKSLEKRTHATLATPQSERKAAVAAAYSKFASLDLAAHKLPKHIPSSVQYLTKDSNVARRVVWGNGDSAPSRTWSLLQVLDALNAQTSHPDSLALTTRDLESSYVALYESLHLALACALHMFVPVTHKALRLEPGESKDAYVIFCFRQDTDNPATSTRKYTSSLMVNVLQYDHTALVQKAAPALFPESLPPRAIPVKANVCKSRFDVGQLHINFGHVDVNSAHTKIITVRNDAEIPLLYRVRPSQFLAASNLNIANSAGIIPGYGSRELPVSFRPTLPGPFDEKITFASVEDTAAFHTLRLKASVKRQTYLSVSPLAIETAANISFFIDNHGASTRRICLSTDAPESVVARLVSAKRVHRLSTEQQEELDNLLQKLRVAVRKNQPDKVEKYNSKLAALGVDPSAYGIAPENQSLDGAGDEAGSAAGNFPQDTPKKAISAHDSCLPLPTLRQVSIALRAQVPFDVSVRPNERLEIAVALEFKASDPPSPFSIWAVERNNADKNWQVLIR